jgi:hypothetical protein
MISTNLITRDSAGSVTYSIAPPAIIRDTTLSADVAQNFTVPSDFPYYQVNFSFDPGLRVFVSYDGSAANIPGASFASTNSELLPASRTVEGGTIISFITPDTEAYVQASLYGIR